MKLQFIFHAALITSILHPLSVRGADIFGAGATVNLRGNTSGTNTLTFGNNPTVYTIGNSAPITPGSYTTAPTGPIGSSAGNQAISGGGAIITPQFTTPNPYAWDTEQLWSNSPSGERVVVEGRIGVAGPGDIEAQIYDWQYAAIMGAYEQYVGNPVPRGGTNTGTNATTGTPFTYAFSANAVPGSTQQTVNSGTAIPFTINYNATTRNLQYTYGTGGPINFVIDNREFDGVLLRINSQDVADAGTRTLALTDLVLKSSYDGTTFLLSDDLVSDVTGDNFLTATATNAVPGQSAGQRQFTLWENPAINDDVTFEITGNATYTWNTATVPTRSRMAFQFKFVEDLALVPEPGAVGLLSLAAGILALRSRSRRRE